MKALSGDFSMMPLPDLLGYLGSHRGTGTLEVEFGGAQKRITIDEGAVVNASSNLRREYLGQFLINLGHITEETFERAYQAQLAKKVFLGRVLIDEGHVTEHVMHAVLAMKYREAILEACTWASGTFRFVSEHSIPWQGGLEVKVPIADILNEMPFRKEVWKQIRATFPRGEGTTLVLRRDRLVEPPRRGSLDEAMFECVEKNQTLEEMMLHLHATDFFFFNRLLAYTQIGALEVKAKAKPSTAAKESRPKDFLSRAHAAHAEGRLGEAFVSAWREQEVSPSAEGTKFLEKLESEWFTRLERHMTASRAPLKLKATKMDLRNVPLSAAEMYLLSRIDGKRSVGQLVRVAPLRDFETLAFLSQFLASGWISREAEVEPPPLPERSVVSPKKQQ